VGAEERRPEDGRERELQGGQRRRRRGGRDWQVERMPGDGRGRNGEGQGARMDASGGAGGGVGGSQETEKKQGVRRSCRGGRETCPGGRHGDGGNGLKGEGDKAGSASGWLARGE
jgi:hypothetical protein